MFENYPPVEEVETMFSHEVERILHLHCLLSIGRSVKTIEANSVLFPEHHRGSQHQYRSL